MIFISQETGRLKFHLFSIFGFGDNPELGGVFLGTAPDSWSHFPCQAESSLSLFAWILVPLDRGMSFYLGSFPLSWFLLLKTSWQVFHGCSRNASSSSEPALFNSSAVGLSLHSNGSQIPLHLLILIFLGFFPVGDVELLQNHSALSRKIFRFNQDLGVSLRPQWHFPFFPKIPKGIFPARRLLRSCHGKFWDEAPRLPSDAFPTEKWGTGIREEQETLWKNRRKLWPWPGEANPRKTGLFIAIKQW